MSLRLGWVNIGATKVDEEVERWRDYQRGNMEMVASIVTSCWLELLEDKKNHWK